MKILDAFDRWRRARAASSAARRKFELVIYFNGPATIWAQRPHEADVICRRKFRSRIFAEVWARSRLRDFERCGFEIDDRQFQMQAESDLRPCPFCRSSDLEVSTYNNSVKCLSCEAVGPATETNTESALEAAWNRRVT